MQTEFEARFLDVKREDCIGSLQRMGGRLLQENTLCKRVVYDIPNSLIASKWLRLRDEGTRVQFTLKHQLLDDHSIRQVKELEVLVSDFAPMREILFEIGHEEEAYQENYRERRSVLIDGYSVEVCFDQWPGLDPYVEIESDNEVVVKKVSEGLGFDFAAARFGTCFDVYQEVHGFGMAALKSLREITFANTPQMQLG